MQALPLLAVGFILPAPEERCGALSNGGIFLRLLGSLLPLLERRRIPGLWIVSYWKPYYAYQDMLAAHGIICNMSGKGECLDKAVAERFFGSLKREWTAHRSYATRQEARDDIIAYIEMFYNSRRKHAYLGDVSPNEYEKLARVA
jgi:transposase InsO family protein